MEVAMYELWIKDGARVERVTTAPDKGTLRRMWRVHRDAALVLRGEVLEFKTGCSDGGSKDTTIITDAASAPQWRVVAVVTAREDGSMRVSKHISDAPHAPDPARAGQAWAATPEGYIRGSWAVLVRVSAPGEAPRVVRLKPRTVIDAEVLP